MEGKSCAGGMRAARKSWPFVGCAGAAGVCLGFFLPSQPAAPLLWLLTGVGACREDLAALSARPAPASCGKATKARSWVHPKGFKIRKSRGPPEMGPFLGD